jgi:hypothetical protein
LVEQVDHFDDLLIKTKKLIIYLEKIPSEKYQDLVDLLLEHPGSTHVEMRMQVKEFNRFLEFQLDEPMNIQMDNGFFENLQSQFGHTNFVEIRL